MKLRKIETIHIEPTPPFDFDSTFHKPDHFTSGDNLWIPGIRWQTWTHSGRCLGLKFQNQGTVAHPKLQVNVYADRKLPKPELVSLTDEIKYRYNLEIDLGGFYKKFGKDPVLAPIL